MVAWFFLTQTVEHRKMLVDLRNIGFYGQYVFVIWNLNTSIFCFTIAITNVVVIHSVVPI